MTALARGQASDCSNPELDLFTLVNGVRTDMFSVEFIIQENVSNPGTPVQVYPPVGRQALNVTDLCPTGEKLGTGRYVAKYTPELTELLGEHIVQWSFKLTAGSPEQMFCESFEILPEATGATSIGYCTVQDIRDEGVPDPPNDVRLQQLISIASDFVDVYTNRFFAARTLSFRLDGRGNRSMLLEHPIINITSVSIDDSVLDLEDVVVYNRHMTQGLLYPDDRDDPRIELLQPITQAGLRQRTMAGFPAGQQNVLIEGVFGYTDPDGSVNGMTPALICEATKLLVMREIPLKYGAGGVDDSIVGYKIIEMKTRFQAVKFSDPNKLGVFGPGPFTGDRRIDNILLRYRAPPRLRSV